MKWALVLSLALVAGPVWAQAPEQSLRPVVRPEVSAPTDTTAVDIPLAAPEAAVSEPRRGLFRSLRPKPRSSAAEEAGRGRKAALRKGAVCGDVSIQGEAIGRVPGKISGCGVGDAVRVRSVSGVRLSTPAVMDCTTAKTLKKWVERGMAPAVGKRGGGVESIRVLASYACRTRNSQKGAKISEHGKGRAIDIGGFTLRNGQEISVLRDWDKGKDGRILRKMHKSACGPFGTVLGPEANRFHRDHFHFDTARYRSGSYCR